MIIMIIILAAVFGSTFYFLGIALPELITTSIQNQPRPPVTVSTATVNTESWQPFFDAVGDVEAAQEIVVTTEVEGTIKEIAFRSGAEVASGDLLVELDTEVDRAELTGLRASAQLAQTNFDRDEKLLKRNVSSASDYETSRAELANARAAVAAKEAVIRKKRIVAPFDGVLGIRRVSLGEYLNPGTEIVTLQALDPAFVNFSLPERALDQVGEGQVVQARVSSYPDRVFTGSVTAIDPRVDEQTRNFTVQANFDNADKTLRPGMFADVRLLTGEPVEVVTVPRTAVETKLYGTSVFLVVAAQNEGGDDALTVERRYVETGLERENTMEITSGLVPGDKVVTAGQLKLQNGSRVTVDNSVELN
jgi:membrane fusion protein (multidrug efflux system)